MEEPKHEVDAEGDGDEKWTEERKLKEEKESDADGTVRNTNLELQLKFEEFLLVFGTAGEPTPEEIREGRIIGDDPNVSIKQVQRYVFEIKGLTVVQNTEKDSDATQLNVRLKKLELREELPNQLDGTMFNKIFFWRSEREAKFG